MKKVLKEISTFILIIQVYGFDIKKINTLNYMGKIKLSVLRSFNFLIKELYLWIGRYRAPDFKKVYVTLMTGVPEIFQQVRVK